jgi:hypothetical protein
MIIHLFIYLNAYLSSKLRGEHNIYNIRIFELRKYYKIIIYFSRKIPNIYINNI